MKLCRQSRAYTLVGLLAALSVLALLAVLVAQLMNVATATIDLSRKQMDADSQARLLFDRMALDFSRMVMRQDIDYHLRKIDGANDEIAFYCEGSGYYSGTVTPSRNARNPVSVIGYRIISDVFNGKPRCQLERASKGLGWEPNGAAVCDMAYLPVTLVSGTNARWPNLFSVDAVDPDFQVLSDQVFRFEYTYLLSDGTFSTKPIRNVPGVKNELSQTAPPDVFQDATKDFTPGSRWFDTSACKGYICLDNHVGAAVWAPLGITDLGGIIVAIALLDPASRVVVNDYARLAGCFPDASATGDIASAWNAVIQSGSFAQCAGVPRQTASAVRIYQRCFPFPCLR